MSSIGNAIRILSCDDHALFRQGIAALLATQPDMSLVAEASNGRDAVQQYRAHRPDITLMDLQMPEMNGLDALTTIRGEFPEARIIVLTTYTGDVQVLRAMKVGARAYLLKNLLDKELLETIRAVHAGKRTLSAEASFELADNRRSGCPAADCRRECQQRDRRSALHHGGDRKGTSQEHPVEIECQ